MKNQSIDLFNSEKTVEIAHMDDIPFLAIDKPLNSKIIEEAKMPAPEPNLSNIFQQILLNAPNQQDIVTPQIYNIVASVQLKCELDLRKIALHAKNSEYNPHRFTALILRINEPNATALVFKNGKLVCVGTKSESDAWTATRKFAKIIKKCCIDAHLDPQIKFEHFGIQNIVGSCFVGFPVNLELLAIDPKQFRFIHYDPEVFPGLIYKMHTVQQSRNLTLLIFTSGKIVITGARTKSDLIMAYENIKPVLYKHKSKSKPIISDILDKATDKI